jgi:hypothetical protein
MTSTKVSASIDVEKGEAPDPVLETLLDTLRHSRPMSKSVPIEIRESLPEDESVDECKARISDDVEKMRQWFRMRYLVPFANFIRKPVPANSNMA